MGLGFLERQVYSSLSLLSLQSRLYKSFYTHIFTHSCSCYSRLGSWQLCIMLRFPTPSPSVRIVELPTRETSTFKGLAGRFCLMYSHMKMQTCMYTVAFTQRKNVFSLHCLAAASCLRMQMLILCEINRK